MKSQAQIRIQECNFHPTHIEINSGTEIEIRIMPHKSTTTYNGSNRSFILSCSEFETQKLYPGDTFYWKFSNSGEYILTCPLYSWMKASIKVKPLKEASFYNPQDPDFLPIPQSEQPKKPKKGEINSYRKLLGNKEFLKYMSISSSATSEPDEEIKDVFQPEEDKLEKDIENLFLSVRDECERERVRPSIVEEDVYEESIVEIEPIKPVEKIMVKAETNIVSIEKQEIKQGVIFTTRAMGPSKYFKKDDPNQKAKIKRLMKRKSRNLKIKLKSNPNIVSEMIDAIINLKLASRDLLEWSDNIPKSSKGESLAERRKLKLQQKQRELQEKLENLSVNFTNSMMEKVKAFLQADNEDEIKQIISQDWAKRNLAIRLFGVNKYWWAEKILKECTKDDFEFEASANLDYKLASKILKEYLPNQGAWDFLKENQIKIIDTKRIRSFFRSGFIFEHFGFIEEEVNELLAKTLSYETEDDLNEQKELIKESTIHYQSLNA